SALLRMTSPSVRTFEVSTFARPAAWRARASAVVSPRETVVAAGGGGSGLSEGRDILASVIRSLEYSIRPPTTGWRTAVDYPGYHEAMLDLPGVRSLRAVVLAAGVGSRLGARTTVMPKPLVPLKGRPLIAYT